MVSKDGAQVPMFIVAPLNVSLDGSNPTMLVGYGAHLPVQGALMLSRRCTCLLQR